MDKEDEKGTHLALFAFVLLIILSTFNMQTAFLELSDVDETATYVSDAINNSNHATISTLMGGGNR